jgi:hypothetical protein
MRTALLIVSLIVFALVGLGVFIYRRAFLPCVSCGKRTLNTYEYGSLNTYCSKCDWPKAVHETAEGFR